MNASLPIIRLCPCPKGYVKDLDKAVSPAQTIARVRNCLAAANLDILAETRRVDAGRLGRGESRAWRVRPRRLMVASFAVHRRKKSPSSIPVTAAGGRGAGAPHQRL